MDPKISAFTPASFAAPFGEQESFKPTPRNDLAPVIPDKVTLSAALPSAASSPAGKNIKVSVLPQDPLVGTAETIDFPQEKISPKLSGERVEVSDRNNPIAIADPDGNYFYAVGTPQFDQVNSHTVVYRTLDMYQDLMGRKIDWAFDSPRITVLPHKQEGKNAYYARWEESVNFFYFNSKELNKTVQTSEAMDVVSHETGHAVLDGLRPNYLGGFSGSETGAFHEAFGDITAMLFTLQDDSSLKAILAENHGDFRAESRVSRLAEEFGKAIHLSDNDPKNDNRIYLRTAINNFVYQDPSTLPDGKDEDKLTSEVHNFARLFTASVYDCLEGMFKQNLTSPQDQFAALKLAGRDLSKIFARAVELSPTSKAKYKDIASAMLKADQQLAGGKYQAVLQKVFMDRKILNRTDLQKDFLPELKLPKTLDSKSEAISFARQHKSAFDIHLPANLKVDSLYRNDRGETFINYSFSREVPVHGEGLEKYKDCVTKVYGGLSLAFDHQGQLMNLQEEPIDADAVKNALNEIRGYEQSGVILKPRTKSEGDKIFNSEGHLYRAIIEPTRSSKKILQKLPVID